MSMVRHMYTALVMTGIVLVTSGMHAQQKAASRSTHTPGIVSGRAFAITKAGDIKPARMADVFLFYMFGSVKEGNQAGLNTAGLAWLDNRNKEVEKQVQELEDLNKRNETKNDQNYERRSDSQKCRTEYVGYLRATSAALDWTTDKNKWWQVITAHADEKGTFRVTVHRSGTYIVVVRGRAGLNEAFWIAELVKVTPDMETVLKLSSPEIACLDIDSSD
jgi:hypothetical protein